MIFAGHLHAPYTCRMLVEADPSVSPAGYIKQNGCINGGAPAGIVGANIILLQ